MSLQRFGAEFGPWWYPMLPPRAPFLIDGLQDGPTRPPRAPIGPPKGLQDPLSVLLDARSV
eukprot:9483738-Pyramimonas_sp.AAC.1